MSRARRARLIDGVAAGLFAGAAGASAALLGGAVVAALAGAVAFGAAFHILSRVDGPAEFELAGFGVGPLDLVPTEDVPELLLTDVVDDESDELLLVDPLPTPQADSRVVRLFDPRTMPKAGDLHERIERHLRSSRAGHPDATAELHSALAALKNSLR